IAREIHDVLTTTHTGALTVGALFAIFFASSGVESLRIGLNRAYGVVETRHWILLRLESIAYVLVAAVGLLALGFLIVLGPLIFRTALRYAPWLEPLEGTFTFFRIAIAVVVLTVALFVAHKWLPAGRRRVLAILPGIVATLVLWLVAGIALGRDLAGFGAGLWGFFGGPRPRHDRVGFLVWDGIDLGVGRRAQGGDAAPALRRQGGDRRHLSAACSTTVIQTAKKAAPPRSGPFTFSPPSCGEYYYPT